MKGSILWWLLPLISLATVAVDGTVRLVDCNRRFPTQSVTGNDQPALLSAFTRYLTLTFT